MVRILAYLWLESEREKFVPSYVDYRTENVTCEDEAAVIGFSLEKAHGMKPTKRR